MTQYTLTLSPTSDNANRDDPTAWSTGTVPDSLDADIVLPLVDQPGTSIPAIDTVAIAPGETYAAGSLNVTSGVIAVAGTLSVAGAISLAPADAAIDLDGGALTLGALDNQHDNLRGSGTLTSTGALTNQGAVIGSGLTVNAPTLENDGSLLPKGGTLAVHTRTGDDDLSLPGNLDQSSFALSSSGPSQAPVPLTITPLPDQPSITLSDGATGLITDLPTIAVTGTASAGSTITIGAGKIVTTAQPTGGQGHTSGIYAANISTPQSPGLYAIDVTASNAAGTVDVLSPLSVYVLPAPIDGTITLSLDSDEFGALLDQGDHMQFSSGTESVQLTDGTLFVGPDTNQAIIERLYQGLLNRLADPQGLGTFDALMSQQGAASVGTAILNSGEFTADHGAMSSLSDTPFIDLLYQGILGRAPDPGGLATFSSLLAGGTSRGAIAADIATSDEAKAHLAATTPNVWKSSQAGALVTELYHAELGRTPDPTGLAGDVAALGRGLTPLQLANAISQSSEFLADHAGQNNAALIASFYNDGLGRSPDPTGLQTFTSLLQSGQTAGYVALAIATSTEGNAHLLRTP